LQQAPIAAIRIKLPGNQERNALKRLEHPRSKVKIASDQHASLHA